MSASNAYLEMAVFDTQNSSFFKKKYF